MKLLPLCLLSVTVLMAQQAAPPARHFGHGPAGDPDQMFEQRLTQRLGLSATQQNEVHTALAERAVVSKGTNDQMRTLRNLLVTAVKTGNESQIDQVSTQLETLRQQETSLHAKTISKIYRSLTPDQQTKVGANLEMLMGGAGFGGPGPRRGPGPHSGPNGAAPASGGSAAPPAPPAAQ